ncbi:MAG: PD-(D/E)XK nuclease family protein [Anaerosomatales bacterium]|nr:PD-(D/E)XK nuclease family protein [Anaerosomatales bacterium]
MEQYEGLPRMSFSKCNTWMRCPYLYKLRYVDRIDDPMPSLPMTFGKAVHSGIELTHLSHVPQCALPDIKSNYIANTLESLIAQLSDIGIPDARELVATTTLDARHAVEVFDALRDKYQVPRASKAYREALADAQERATETSTMLSEHMRITRSTPTLLAYLTDLFNIDTNMQAYNDAYPLARNDEDTPYSELELIVPMMDPDTGEPAYAIHAFIDDIRLDPEGKAFANDYKTGALPTPELVDYDYQLVNYQMLMALSDDLPAPSGARLFNPLTGERRAQRPVSLEMHLEWGDQLDTVRAAIAGGIFPRRRSRECTSCTHQEYCVTPGAIGDQQGDTT